MGVLDGYPAQRLVLELTEHAVVQDYASLQVALHPLRQRGVRRIRTPHPLQRRVAPLAPVTARTRAF